MRILLDECVDWRLLRDLTDYDAKTVKQVGWQKLKNGALLNAAASEFDVFVTVDKDMPTEHSAVDPRLAVIVLRGRTTRLSDLRELLGELGAALREPRFGQFEIVSWRDLTVSSD
jgi:predicted nuclease of predicted toxin-antitoxin system